MPWNGDGMSANLDANKQIPQESFDNACITTEDQAVAEANRIGYPVMLKASEGGGGPQRVRFFVTGHSNPGAVSTLGPTGAFALELIRAALPVHHKFSAKYSACFKGTVRRR